MGGNISLLKIPFNVNHGKTNQQNCGSRRRLSTRRITARERGVNLGSEDFFEPPLINEKQEQSFLQKILTDPRTTITDKALTVMYHNMRQQIFWDGNKRTATLSANKIMIDGGAGLINIPLDKWDQWNELIANYYRTNDMTEVKKWTYDNGIQGLQIRANKKLSVNHK